MQEKKSQAYARPTSPFPQARDSSCMHLKDLCCILHPLDDPLDGVIWLRLAILVLIALETQRRATVIVVLQGGGGRGG